MTIVLAMHGAPPTDYPREELQEFFKLHLTLEHGSGEFPKAMYMKNDQLHEKLRNWPRTSANDPFWNASHRLAEELERITNREVIVGFNEFCTPSIEEALEKAVLTGESTIDVITPMMTPGGEHSEIDIPQSIKKIQDSHPEVTIQYRWPFELSAVASFLAEQLSHH